MSAEWRQVAALPFTLKVAILAGTTTGVAMADITRGGLGLLLAIGFAGMGSGAAMAQSSDMRLIREPAYGELRDVLGAVLPVAPPSARCARPAQLPDGACLEAVLAGMKARGATTGRILTAPAAGGGAGTVISGPIGEAYRLYDVTLTGGGPRVVPVTLPSSSVRVPRDCFATGRGVDYRVDLRDGQLAAREVQAVSCGGPVPPIGYGGPRRPPIGPNEPGERWPATATVEVLGAPRQLAAPRPDCPPDAALRDGVCFAAGIAELAFRPELKELDVIGAKRPVAPGVVLTARETEQYVLKRGRKGFKADKRWFDKSSLAAPAGCGLTSPVDFEVEAGDRVHERALAGCGAPPAPPPVATYEAYGAVMPVVMGNRPGCAERGEQLLGGACFTDVIGWMRARKIPKTEALVLDGFYRPGERVHDGGPIRFSYATVWVNPDGTYKADRKHGFSAQIRAGGCSTLTDAGGEASGVTLIRADGGVMARAYQWVACPVR
jgi:hypothetical protein